MGLNGLLKLTRVVARASVIKLILRRGSGLGTHLQQHTDLIRHGNATEKKVGRDSRTNDIMAHCRWFHFYFGGLLS